MIKYLIFASALLWLGQADEVYFRCPNKGHLYGRRCFTERADSKNFDDANKFCEFLGGNLLRMKNDEIGNFIKGKLNPLFRYWVGIKAYDSTRNWEFVDRTPVTNYHPWSHGEPNNWWGSEYCVELHGGNVNWNDNNCANKLHYICEGPAEIVCPNGWTASPDKKMCIQAVSDHKLTWDDARQYCKNKGGDLLRIDNAEIQDTVKNMLKAGLNYWVGMRAVCKNSKFMYLDLVNVHNYNMWGPGEPNNLNGNEYCVEIIGPGVGFWNDDPCNRKNAFVCQLS